MSTLFDTSLSNGKHGEVIQKRIIPSDDECDLKEENLELKHQNRKQVEDLRETKLRLHDAEDKNQSLEVQIQRIQRQLHSTNQRLEKATEDYRREIELQNETLEVTTQRLREKSSRLNRLEKEFHEMEAEKNEMQGEVEKACSELEWYHFTNTKLKTELHMAEDAFRRQLNEYSWKSLQLDQENARISLAMDELRIAHEKIEQEKSELEAVVRTRASQNKDYALLNDSVYEVAESNGVEEMDSSAKLFFEAAFPPLDSAKSIFAEIQCSLQQSPFETTVTGSSSSEDASTQTHDEGIPLENHHDSGEFVCSLCKCKSEDVLSPPIETTERRQSVVGPSQTNVKLRNRRVSWSMLPIDNRGGTVSMGIIPDEEQERMRQYAFDVPSRSCNPDAAILPRKDWRTLHVDLDELDLQKFKKSYGQEEDADEGGLYRASTKTEDLDELAETYCEQFPFLSETIFQHLESVVPADTGSALELPQLKRRFEELATTFRTDHENLDLRCDMAHKEYHNAKEKISHISSSLKESVAEIRAQKMPGELREVFNAIETGMTEFDLRTESLDRSAKRKGRLDFLVRTFKLIEVMALYVRILNNVCGNINLERNMARQLLNEHGLPFPNKSSALSPRNDYWMGNRKESLNPSPLERLVDRTDEKKTVLLQTLLGPKQCYSGSIMSEIILRESQPQKGYFSRLVSKWLDGIERELNWPWNGEQTWHGTRRIFSLLLMFFGIVLIYRMTLFPACDTRFDLESFLSFSQNHAFPRR